MTIEHTHLGVFVIAVAADSIADRAGVLPGDEIRAVQSFDAHVHGGQLLVKELVRPQLDDVKLVMRRNGEVVDATLRIAH
jgi:C-terminal processing protease CtpA/Prc